MDSTRDMLALKTPDLVHLSVLVRQPHNGQLSTTMNGRDGCFGPRQATYQDRDASVMNGHQLISGKATPAKSSVTTIERTMLELENSVLVILSIEAALGIVRAGRLTNDFVQVISRLRRPVPDGPIPFP